MQIETAGKSEFDDLMSRLRDGSESAAWELVERYGNSIKRVIRRNLNEQMRSKFDSIDFVQAVWISLFRERERFVGFQNPAQLTGYLMGMAKNKLAHEHRRRLQTQKHNLRREQPTDEQFQIAEQPSSSIPRPSEVAQVRELWHMLLANQSEQNQKIAKLRMSGMTYEEIGAQMGINERTARRVIERLSREADK